MRNPLASHSRSDTHQGRVGDKDKELSIKLAKAGPEHAKHLRMIMVWAEIAMPRLWWIEYDTYRFGVEKLSHSTMHKLTSRDFVEDDFAIDDDECRAEITSYMNERMAEWRVEEDPVAKKARWRKLIQCLPQSYIQRRTVMMSYAALRNIIKQRTGHRLIEWKQFIDWARTLPESWMLFSDEPDDGGDAA